LKEDAMFRVIRALFVVSMLLSVGCASRDGNTLGRFRNQTFAGIVLVGNGSLEEMYRAGGYLQDKLEESGVSFCNNCRELQERVDADEWEPYNKLQVHPETASTSQKPKAAWGIITFRREEDGTFTADFEVFTDLTSREFEEIVRRHRWPAEPASVNRILLL
jgi:hypothetical protein